MGSCWVSASATASWCTTACAASPSAASATPAPRGPSSPVSAHGPAEPGDAWLGGWLSGGGSRMEQGSILRSMASPGYQPGAVRVSCHRPPHATRSVVPNTLVCDVAGSVLLCSAPRVPVAQVSMCLHLTWVSAPDMGVCVTSRCVCPGVLLSSDPKGNRVTSTLGAAGTQATRTDLAPSTPLSRGRTPVETLMPRPNLCQSGDGAGGWEGSSVL